MRTMSLVLLAAAFASTSVWAQTTQSGARMSSTPGIETGMTAGGGIAAGSDASAIQGQGGAVAGGVGLNAREALRSGSPKHNVKLVFALNTGNYLADVDVKITNKAGQTVVDGVSDGPWLYARLPAGSYTARATYSGHTVTKRFSVGAKGATTTHLRWPASVEQRAQGTDQILGTGPQPSNVNR